MSLHEGEGRYLNQPTDPLPVGVDFDGVIAESIYPVRQGIGPLIPGSREYIRRLREDGHSVTINTARSWGEAQAVRNYLADHEIPYDDLVMGKHLSKLLIDDRVLRFEGDWQTAYYRARRILGLK